MDQARAACRKILTVAMLLTLAGPVGAVMLGVGQSKGIPLVWGPGIGLIVICFYGCAIGWVNYAMALGRYRLVFAIVNEHLYTEEELAAQLGQSVRAVHSMIDVCFRKGFLIGYKRVQGGISLNENEDLVSAQHEVVCPACGAKVQFQGLKGQCPYCGSLVSRK